MNDAYIIIKRVKRSKNGNIMIDVDDELFDDFMEAEKYVKNHYMAKDKRVRGKFYYETEDFEYEIKPLHKVLTYWEEKDYLILEGEE